MHGTDSSRRRRRLWKFASAEFDEARWELRVGGQSVALEGKPLQVLHELLLRAGEVVTKEELLDSVWPGVTVVEGSLATAISKVRKAFGERAEEIVATVPRVGYRLAAPVSVEAIDTPLAPRFSFAPGDMAPGRPQWRLERPLGATGAADVWVADHVKTRESRVFKFADAPDRLRSLKREAALSRLLTTGLGRSAPVAPLLEWNFDTSPYFLEYAYGGRDLIDWFGRAGGVPAVPLEQRLRIGAMICRAVAAVHGMGVLHKDLKPSNVLIDEAGSDQVVRLVDFGSGRLLDIAVLDSFGITNPDALDAELGTDEGRSGTLAYRAPELSGDALPTVKSDIYALGLILYQLVVGDFSRSLAPGWEDDIDDPLLRADIRSAAEGAPERRLGSAAELAERIDRLDERRLQAAREAEREERLAAQQVLEQRRAARRPWIRAAVASLVVCIAGTSSLAAYAMHQRNEARRAQQVSEASYRFLAEDVLASVDPARAGAAEETLVEAVNRAAGTIDQRFASRPLVAAYLHGALARAFDLRSEFGDAFRYYAAADQAYDRAGASDSLPALHTRLQFASALALSTQPGTLERARALIEEADRLIADRRITNRETLVWQALAKGMVALVTEDIPATREHFGLAYRIAETIPETFSPRVRLNLGQRYAFSLLRLGEGAEAERTFTALVAAMTDLVGEDHPDTLLLRLNLAQAFLVQQRFEEAASRMTDLLPLMEQRLGRDHRHTLLLLGARQQALGSMARYAEAAADGERLWRAAARKDGSSSFAAVAGRTDTGISYCRSGQLARGAGEISAALAALRQDLAGRAALEDALQAALADCYIQMRRYDEAEELLNGVDRVKVSQLVGDQNWGAQVDLALAEIALGRGDRDEARRSFARAKTPLAATNDAFVRQRLTRIDRTLGSTS